MSNPVKILIIGDTGRATMPYLKAVKKCGELIGAYSRLEDLHYDPRKIVKPDLVLYRVPENRVDGAAELVDCLREVGGLKGKIISINGDVGGKAHKLARKHHAISSNLEQDLLGKTASVSENLEAALLGIWHIRIRETLGWDNAEYERITRYFFEEFGYYTDTIRLAANTPRCKYPAK